MKARRVATAAAVLLPVVLAGCEPANDNPPDQLLQDSLGLESSDPVLRVELSAPENLERPRPETVRVPPGGFVEFRTADRRLHTVRVLLDSLPAAGADFLRTTGQDRSPPLLEQGARFVVSFRDAPAGRYPYLVEGIGEDFWPESFDAEVVISDGD